MRHFCGIHTFVILVFSTLLFNSCKKDSPFPPDPVSVTDVDGNTYNVKRIGSQVWMTENLRTTKWPDGTAIDLITTNSSWTTFSPTMKAYCWYNNDPSNKNIYGALYTWSAALGACPTGWHVPTKDEWSILGNPAKLNNFQFGGIRTETGMFLQKDFMGYWWTSTEFVEGWAWNTTLIKDNGNSDFSTIVEFRGISVRCIKDQ